MPHQIPRPYDAGGDDYLYDDLFSVASSMECTGLIPAAPDSVSEVDSYSEIYDIPLTKNSVTPDHQIQSSRKAPGAYRKGKSHG